MKNLMKLSVVLVAAALAFSSCNCFKKMAKNRDDINLTVTPEILTLNNGIVAADINVTFPVKYFNAKAVIKVTPVIVFEGGEVAGAAKYLQGSKVDENYTVVDKKNGGSYTQHVEFPYDPRMDKCALQLRAEIKCPGGKCKEFTLVNLNTGAIPTKEEAAVLAWKEQNGLDFLRCACRFTEDSAGGSQDSKRMEMKRLLKELRKTDPLIPMRIFRSVHNVDLDTVIGYTQKGVRHSFLENFSDKEDHEEKE